jgi:hypothetical protein
MLISCKQFNLLNTGLTIWMSIPYLAIWGVNVYISRLLRVVRNTIFRKAPPSVVSGYGKRSINLNKVVAKKLFCLLFL